jgi:hypothetical protein
MNSIIDVLYIAFSGLDKLSLNNFYLTIIGGLIFSIVVGLTCHFFYKLWNKSYVTTFTHKLMSVFSSILSFFFIICYVGFTFLEEVAMTKILIWKEEIIKDQNFIQKTFIKAYDNVKELEIEDFSNTLSPNQGGNQFPTSKRESKLKAGETYYEESINNFQDKHGFLNAILSVKSNNTPEQIQKNMDDYFSKGNQTYDIIDGIEIAANNLKSSLIQQAPRVVKISRILLVLLFFIIQIIPFGIISYSAYKDLKIGS